MKKILALALALILLLSNISVYGENVQNSYFDEKDKKADSAYENEKVKSLIIQSKGKIGDDEVRAYMVEFDPAYFSDLGSMVSAKELYTDAGIKKQLEFAEKANKSALDKIKSSGIELKVECDFKVLMIGISAEMTFEDAKTLAGLDFVKKIILQPLIEKPVLKEGKRRSKRSLRTMESRDMIGNETVYSKYKGQGKLVAIIDSGFDPEHEAFYLTKEGKEKAKYSKADIDKLKSSKLLERGFYINEKIPFAYNYYPGTNPEKIKEKSDRSHGQHVAGTVGANHVDVNLGEQEISLSGVAPEAQLALMRVFSDDIPGTSPALYVKALEDCVILKVDAVNMSLGSVAGDSTTIFPDATKMFERLEEAGCVVAIAAGNETAFGAKMGYKPKAEYPDYGILGDPAAAEKSFAVASIENGTTVKPYFTYKDKSGNEENLFLEWSKNEKNKTVEPEYDKEFDLVYVGLGKEEDYKNVDVNGKVVLIERGGNTFEDKTIRAKEKGAKAVFIYNHQEGGDEFVAMAGAGKHEIAVASLYYSTGIKLKNTLGKVIFKKGNMSFYNPLAGQISKFSSFGLTADGTFKPDITAPGGNIYSLGNNNTYNLQSGTSMATPHIAGGLALVSSMVDEKFPELSPKQKYQRIRNLIMSTAQIHYFNKVATSPRRQGAGVMKLQKALNTKAILIGDNNETKLFNKNAKNIQTFNFKIQNLSDETITYKYKSTIVADDVNGSYLTYFTRWLKDVNNGSVTLSPKQTKDLSVTIDTSEFADELKSQMPNGYFVDGFIIFENDDEPTISIPFITFVGDLDKVQVVESPIYDLTKENKVPFYWNEEGNCHIADRNNAKEIGNNEFTHLFTNIGNKTEILGQSKDFTNKNPKFYDKHVLSPNKDGYADYLNVKYTMLRSGNISVNVYKLDENGNKVGQSLANLVKDEMTIKNYGSNILGNAYYIDIPFPNSKTKLDDGNYVVSISSYRNKNKPLDDINMNFTVDTKKPTVQNFKIQDNILSFDSFDENGIREELVKINDKVIEKSDKGYEIPQQTDLKDIVVEVKDLGYNTYKTTAEMELNNKKSSVNIVPKLNKNDDEFNLEYKIFDEKGIEFYSDNLKPGKYKLEIKKPEEIYQIKDIDGVDIKNINEVDGKYVCEFTLENAPKEILINIDKLDAYYVYYWVYDYTKEFKGVKLINQDNNTQIDLDLVVGQNSDNYVGAKAFSKLIPYGRYKVEFDADKTNYKFEIFREFDKGNGINDKEKADYNCIVEKNSKLNSAGNISFAINPEKKNFTINVYGEGQENADFKLASDALDFDRSNNMEIKSIARNLPLDFVNNSEIEPKDYMLAAIPKEGYYAEPALYLLELKSSRVTAYPSKAEYKVSGSNVNLQVDIKKSSGNGSLVIEDNIGQKQGYIVQDIRGYFGYNDKVYRDLNNLPEGNYIISPLIDKNTEFASKTGNKLVKVTSGESTRADFKFSKIETDMEGALVISSPEKIKVQIKNLKTGALVDMIMDYEEDGKQNYLFSANQGVYELIINDGASQGFVAPKYFVMTADSYINVGKDPNFKNIKDDEGLRQVLTELKELVEKTKTIDESIYTEDSLNAFKECLSKIKESYNDEEEAKKALATLKSAFESLKEKSKNNQNEKNPEPIEPVVPIIKPYNPGNGNIGFFKSNKREKIGEEKSKDKPNKDYGVQTFDKVSPTKFNDITAEQKEVLDFVTSRKIMKGTGIGKFSPNATITRAMVVETLMRISKDKTSSKNIKFNDVALDQWYADSVLWAASHKYVLGDGNGNFKPNKELTRQELALIFARFLKNNEIDMQKTKDFKFADENSIPKWSLEAVKAMEEIGLIEGKDANKYNPDSKISRYELAKTLMVLVKWVENQN